MLDAIQMAIDLLVAASTPAPDYVGTVERPPLGHMRVFHDDADRPHEHRRNRDGTLGPAIYPKAVRP